MNNQFLKKKKKYILLADFSDITALVAAFLMKGKSAFNCHWHIMDFKDDKKNMPKKT